MENPIGLENHTSRTISTGDNSSLDGSDSSDTTDGSAATSLDTDSFEIYRGEDAIKHFQEQVDELLKVMKYSVQAFGENINEIACIAIQMLLCTEIEKFRMYKRSMFALLKGKEDRLLEKVAKKFSDQIKIVHDNLDSFKFQSVRLSSDQREEIAITTCIVLFDPKSNPVDEIVNLAEYRQYSLMNTSQAELLAHLVLFRWLVVGVDTHILEQSIKNCGKEFISKSASKSIRETLFSPIQTKAKKNEITYLKNENQRQVRLLNEYARAILRTASRIIKSKHFMVYATFLVDALFAVDRTHFEDAVFCLEFLIKEKIKCTNQLILDDAALKHPRDVPQVIILARIQNLSHLEDIWKIPLATRRHMTKEIYNEFLRKTKECLLDQQLSQALNEPYPFTPLDELVDLGKHGGMPMRGFVIEYTLCRAFQQRREAIGQNLDNYMQRIWKKFKAMSGEKKAKLALTVIGFALRIGLKTATMGAASEGYLSWEEEEEETTSYLIK